MNAKKVNAAYGILACSILINLAVSPFAAKAEVSDTTIPVPANTAQVTSSSQAENNQFGFSLKATRNTYISPPQRLEELVKIAIDRSEQAQQLNQKASKKFKNIRKVARRVKSMAQFATAYQGFASSSEAADIILSEKLKLKHANAIEYVQQKQLDEMHTKLFMSMSQIAQGVGITNNEQRREKIIAAGTAEMEKLVGKEETDKTLSLMTAWSKNASVPESTFSQDSWDVMETQGKSNQILTSALKDDSVVKAIEARLHKFNHRSNFARATSKIVNTSLSVAMFSPTLIAPAAQVAQLVFVALTGGPEEEKLLKEVYLDRCFESRFKRLNTEASLAVNNYNMAILTKNPALLLCSESMLAQMAGRTPAEQVLGQAMILPAEQVKPVEITLKQPKKEKKVAKEKMVEKENKSDRQATNTSNQQEKLY